jgi:transcriptional regulator with XRE-family HTH domain
MFKESLKKLRAEKGLTQEAFAALVPCSRTLVSKWESGASYPVREDLIRLSAIFAIPVSELIGEEETTLIAVGQKQKRIPPLSLVLFGLSLLIVLLLFLPFVRYVEEELKMCYATATSSGTPSTYYGCSDFFVYSNYSFFELILKKNNAFSVFPILTLVLAGVGTIFAPLCAFVPALKQNKASAIIQSCLIGVLIALFIITVFAGLAAPHTVPTDA